MAGSAARPGGLRERKKELTRVALIEAAERLFAERGYDHVTVAEIADTANISVKTLFTYFDAKEDLAFAGEGELRDHLVTAIRTRRPRESPLDAARDALREFAGRPGDRVDTVGEFRRQFGESVALQNRLRRMWSDYEDAVTAAIAERGAVSPGDARLQAMQVIALARSAATPEVAEQISAASDPRQALFDWLEHATDMLEGRRRRK